MIVEDERDKYTQYDVSQFQQGEGNGSTQVDRTYSTNMPSNLCNILGNRIRLRDVVVFRNLCKNINPWVRNIVTFFVTNIKLY